MAAIEVADAGGGVSQVTLAGTKRDGYLDTPALLDLAAALDAVGRDPAVRVVIITGADGAFCRGRVGAKGLTRASAVADDLNAILKVNAAHDALRVPVIAAVEGPAFGFGFGLSCQADVTIAAENAVFALPEMSHGLPPLVVLSYLFRFVPYKRAFELAVTSREISAPEALAAGVVTELAAPGTALPRAMNRARAMAAMDPKGLALLRTFARRAADVHAAPLSEHAVSIMSVLLSERAQDAAR